MKPTKARGICLAFLMVAVSALTGCRGGPEVAHVIATGDSDRQVRLIVSTWFLVGPDEMGNTRVAVITADTITTTLPLDYSFSLRDERVFAELSAVDGSLDQVHMLVLLDGSREFDEEGPLVLGSPRRFAYAFGQRLREPLEIVY